MLKTDILVIGTGIAGLSFAIKTALKRPDLSILIMTKETAESSNTQYAQGGIAVVIDRLKDSFDQHIEDTIKAGDGACDLEIVDMVIRQAPKRLEELIGLGIGFDQHAGRWDLALEGGHSQRRILHVKDATGREIENALLHKAKNLPNITILEHHYVIDLITEQNGYRRRCVGAFYFDSQNSSRYVRSKAIVLSTGGCGQLFKHTTNAPIATGDGVAIAHRAKAKIEDMNYIQFHPTAMYEPGKNPCFLLSEALRGSGAHIVNDHGKRFVFAYDLRGELATRDIVSRAIAREMQNSGQPHVYLDCRHLDRDEFTSHFESIYKYCKGKGIDPLTDLIPIIPVAHYQCGGVTVNKNAQTTVNGLYAIGECARTGLHGKNRLASNSLLEAVVFAHQASLKICEAIDDVSYSPKFYVNQSASQTRPDLEKIDEIKTNIKSILEQLFIDDASQKAAADIARLTVAAEKIFEGQPVSRPVVELLNMLTVASLVVEHSNKNNLILK